MPFGCKTAMSEIHENKKLTTSITGLTQKPGGRQADIILQEGLFAEKKILTFPTKDIGRGGEFELATPGLKTCCTN
ncbi:hypothetical protein ACNKHO_24015 [Shigella flexneri]